MSLTITTDDGQSIRFDHWDGLSLSGDVQVAEHPVEKQDSVSDNAQEAPRSISFNVMQTETPFEVRDGESSGEARILDAESRLQGLVGEVVTVTVPRMGDFEEYTLKSFPMTLNSARSASWSVTFKKVRIAEVTTSTVTPVQVIRPQSRSGQQEESDQGSQPSEEGDEAMVSAEDTPPPSALKKALEGIGL